MVLFLIHVELIADDVEYDPNANVPLWVNIVVPIISVVIFVYIVISAPKVWYCCFFHLGLMVDDAEYDSNANVPLWVNIVIPIISEVIFLFIFFISEPMVWYCFSFI